MKFITIQRFNGMSVLKVNRVCLCWGEQIEW